MKVMIADAEFMSRHIVTQLFSQNSFEPVYVSTQEQAMAELNSDNPPRLLLLDFKMPHLDAKEICRWVREKPSPPSTYIILMMPQSSLANLLPALDAGADEFITKPLNREELRARLRVARRWLENDTRSTNIMRGWRVMLDNLPFGVAALGQHDQFLRVNRVFVDLLGHEMKDVVGKNLLSTTLRRTNDLAHVRNGIRNSEAFDWIEMEVYHKNGTKKTLVVWGRPINAGELVFQIVTATE
jgi:PAS domain S-box-containing protein